MGDDRRDRGAHVAGPVEDVAAAIVAYASDLTGHVTGGCTAVDGGLSGT
ncbi:hypothetical protein ACWEV3_28825 [Saccharopolyspora sp. NPDC003752]